MDIVVAHQAGSRRRVRLVYQHLATKAAAVPHAPLASTLLDRLEGDPAVPLSDEEVKQFIVDGFLLKEIDDVPPEYHLRIYKRCIEERERAAQLPGHGRLQGGNESSHVASLDDFDGLCVECIASQRGDDGEGKSRLSMSRRQTQRR